ncbi:MAG: selenide, water dikinase SelD [Actinomycetota bacterium]|jgi:selenide,water dikinase
MSTADPRVGSSASSPDLRLTEWTSCGGCAAKWGKDLLAGLVGELPDSDDAALLIGLAPFDDAAVYKLSNDLALVSTTDFFPPLVDDPEDFGAIAAANACSDVFAMGGRVLMAVNIAAFPEHFPREAIVAIFSAASEVVTAAGGSVAGGHTIRNPEPIFGLAVQGLVHPDRIFTKGGAREGDVLVLSKPLGTGLVLAGGSPSAKAEAIRGMRSSNRRASELLQSIEGVHAVTDVTGYGLAGHGWEMAERSGCVFEIDVETLPFYSEALDIAERGVRTGGDARNRTAVGSHVAIAGSATTAHDIIAFDPQTSGGLLAAVDPSHIDELLAGDSPFQRIGRVVDGSPRLVLR